MCYTHILNMILLIICIFRFLLAELHVEAATQKNNKRELLKALCQLPTNISETYTEAIDRIKSQCEEDEELAMKTLMWITTALRPLKLLELQHALAVQPGDTSFDINGITDKET